MIFGIMLFGLARGTVPTPGEFRTAGHWADVHLGGDATSLPFSFVYAGMPASELLPGWTKQVERRKLDATRTQWTTQWTAPTTGLEVRCVAVLYSDFPAVEWTVYLKNTGHERTPIIEKLQGLEVQVQREKGPEFVLHHQRGDVYSVESYVLFAETLAPNTTLRLAPVGGRPTNSGFPYYNLQMPDRGLIVAVGWPGQWAAEFRRDDKASLHISAGQELTHLYLNPGEEIRTPLAVLLFWQGSDVARAQNLWRRWMLAHNLPHPGGRAPGPIYTSSDSENPEMRSTEAGQKQAVNAIVSHGVKLDFWWIDAGWYNTMNRAGVEGDWHRRGTWEPDPGRYPHGIRPVSDQVHASGMKLILWFEPEHVSPDTWLARTHPEWLLKSDDPHDNRLLDLGNADAIRWLTDHVDRLIRDQGVDVYRSDFNMDPLPYWRRNDPPDRQGITENLYVQGYLAFWDELLRRHPDLLIDTCASGGRRNDLETLRRSVPLWRSDYGQLDDPETQQRFTQALSSWLPYYGTNIGWPGHDVLYFARSQFCPAFGIGGDLHAPSIDWELFRQVVAQWRQIAPFMLADFYPLTSGYPGDESWVAWQFDRPERGDGMVQAFRHASSRTASRYFRLSGVDSASDYQVTDVDTGKSITVSGQQLLERGVVVDIPSQPGSVVLLYRAVKP
ncbi:MAG TPA: glycoside hydrolase family 36 protein [Opitutaceae bacterium]|nr:glycoside hydrolase family 36 protein [Opitutaceae bacterium]